MKSPIYLDYAATCPVDTRVADKMMSCLTLDGIFGNPASKSHIFGWQAAEEIDIARNHIADLVSADAREIIFTSGATESNNLALKGIAIANQDSGKHIITCTTEHKSVLDSCHQLEQQGFEVTYLTPKPDGLIDIDSFQQALRSDTILVSIMHVNNEIGVIQDLVTLGNLCRANKTIFHVDAAQSVGKIAIDLATLPVDLMSFTAHKIYGPKGIGALYIRGASELKIEPMMHGGGHERGMRSGTLPTHQIAGMGEAYRICKLEMHAEMAQIEKLRNNLYMQLKDIPGIIVNGSMEQRVGTNLNVSFSNLNGQELIMHMLGVAVSSGSACNSEIIEPSYVLTALGIEADIANTAIRFSLGRYTTSDDIDQAAKIVKNTIQNLRSI